MGEVLKNACCMGHTWAHTFSLRLRLNGLRRVDVLGFKLTSGPIEAAKLVENNEVKNKY